jgi:hypothetical protein
MNLIRVVASKEKTVDCVLEIAYRNVAAQAGKNPLNDDKMYLRR